MVEALRGYLQGESDSDAPACLRVSDWADYYALGRWMVLGWMLATQEDVPDWQPHPGLVDGLRARLSERVAVEEEARRAVNALSRLQPLLAALAHEANAPRREELRRALEITMQELAP